MTRVPQFIIVILLFLSKFERNMASDPTTLPVEKKALFMPPLQEIADILDKSLRNNFEEVDVSVVDCPDLTQKPFTLANKGLSGKPKLVEVGGVPYLLPLVQRDRLYNLKNVAEISGNNPAFIIGAGAGPHPYVGVNCEGIINVNIQDGNVDQKTRIAKVAGDDEHVHAEILPNNETRVALLGNLFVSEGKPGKVLKVHVKKRIGPKNFIESIRNTIEESYKNKLVGLGGTFVMNEGKAKQHVMRDFSKTPLDTEEQLNEWLKFYNMSAPLIAVGTLSSNDGGDLDLRVQHFHSFSHHGEAGHYHYDTTPDIVEYLGYFNVGEEIIRIDKPVVTHKIGRD